MPKPDFPMRLSRRQWAASVAALAPLAGRAQAPPATPVSDLDACREDVRRNQAAVRRARVPRETEPAFRFRA